MRRWHSSLGFCLNLFSVITALALAPGLRAAPCDPAPANLIGWWTGDGDATSFTGTNNGALQGGATAIGAGLVAQCFTFSGTNQFVQIPDAAALHPTNLTIEAWVLFTSLTSPALGGSPTGDQYLVFKQNSRTYDFEGFDLSKTRIGANDVFRFLISSSGGAAVEIDSTTPIVTNTWYHVAAVRGANTMQLYVNGALQAQATISFAQNYGALPLYFGTSGQSYWDHKLAGRLDEVSLYGRALSASEIAAIFAAGSAGKCKGAQPPAITGQPQNQSVALGGNASFAVTATGTAPLSYQWQFASASIADATNSNLSLVSVQNSNGGNYNVIVTNALGSVTSSVAVLSVLLPPTITNQPVGLTNLVGSTATFTAAASGSAPLSYQWRLNGVNLANSARISGATSNTLIITSLLSTDAGSYTLFVNNAVGSTTSAPAALVINAPPGITGQPNSQTVLAGANVNFSVTASGTAPFGYQWLLNGLPLTDGGNLTGSLLPTLSLSNVQTNNAGPYQVIVTNAFGAATSLVASLTVNVPGSCLPPPSGLIGWWPGEGNANDAAALDNGALSGGVTATAAAFVGQGFTFDGNTGFVSIPDNSLLHPTNLTIEAWVRFSSLNSTGSGSSPAGDQYIVFKQNAQTYNFEGFDLSKTRIGANDVFRFLVTSPAGATVEVDSTTHIATNTWYHVAGVRGSNSIQLYVNGALQASSTVSFPQNYGTLPLYFGTSGQSYWDHKLAGMLDEVSLYNRALSASEIAAIYAAGSGGKCKGQAAPTIVSQPASAILVVGGAVTFNVGAIGSLPLGYQWYKDGFKLTNSATVSGATGASLFITNLSSANIGDYQVVVTNAVGTVTSAVASLSTGVPPANDNFATAIAISGTSGSVSGNNANGTKQAGEPNHAGNAGGPSVWYNWTASSTSPVTFDTAMSGFDTLLAVYTGSSVGALTQIAANNDISTNNARSRLTFTPVSGTVYRIAVDGANGANGNFTLRWAQASVALPDLSLVASAVNPQISTENFAATSCAVQEGLIQAGTRTIIRFDTETENSGAADLFFGNPANNPLFVWAPCHAHYHFQNYMSYRLRGPNGQIVATGLKVGFCILDVFRWSSSSKSTATYNCNNQGIQVGWGDLYDSTLDGQWIDITGLPPGNYTMELEANPQGIIQESNYGNNLITVPITIGNPNAAPANDNFANPQTLLGGFSSTSGVTGNATKQNNEPSHAGNAGGHSVWYRWQAVDTKPVTIDTIGSSFNTLLGVYTGGSLGSLSLVASNDDIGAGNLQSRVTFNATANTVYDIAVDGFNGASGNLILTLDQTIQNDNFANCQFVGGVNGIAYGANNGATKENGEPSHAGNAGGASIWYCWTSPITGTVTFDTVGSSFNTLLAVYTGNSVATLTPIASNDDIDPLNTNLASRVSFTATGLTMYHIAIDGFNGATGDTALNWNLVASGNQPMSQFARQNIAAISPASGPRVTSSFLSEGEFQLAIAGSPSQLYRIEISCDLSHWVPSVTTLADDSGMAYFTDKTTMNMAMQSSGGDPICGPGNTLGAPTGQHKGRFYRAIAVTPSN